MSSLLDVRGLAERLGVSTDWVYTQVEAKAIPHTRLPGKSRTPGKEARRLIRFTAQHVADILAAGEQQVETEPVVGLKAARARAHARRAATTHRRSA